MEIGPESVIATTTPAGAADEQGQQSRVKLALKSYVYPLLHNLHQLLPPLPHKSDKAACSGLSCSTFLTRGDFYFFHYQCDGFPDDGWGCAYRTLQSACTWILKKRCSIPPQTVDVHMKSDEDDRELLEQIPSIGEIQQTLVDIGDKPSTFVGSRDWIGALEVFYALDALYNVPCKILHIPQREDLKKYANVLKKYFEDFGGFVMMGGDMDAASKGIAGIHISGNQAYFLVIDPHYVGEPKSAQELIDRGFIRWQHTSDFVDSSFYNLCLPQIK